MPLVRFFSFFFVFVGGGVSLFFIKINMTKTGIPTNLILCMKSVPTGSIQRLYVSRERKMTLTTGQAPAPVKLEPHKRKRLDIKYYFITIYRFFCFLFFPFFFVKISCVSLKKKKIERKSLQSVKKQLCLLFPEIVLRIFISNT